MTDSHLVYALHDNTKTTAEVVLLLLRFLVTHLLLWLASLLILHLLLLLVSRVPAGSVRVTRVVVIAQWVCGLIDRLSVLWMLWLVVVATKLWLLAVSAKINVHPTLILLSSVLQPKLLTDLFNPWLDLLDVSRAVVTLANDHMQVRLSLLTSISNPLLQDLLCLFDILTVEVNGICRDLTNSVVFSEDEFGSLLVEGIGLCGVLLALFAQSMRLCAIAARVCCLRLRREMLTLTLLLASCISQAIVFSLRAGRWTVVESCLKLGRSDRL